MLNLSGDKYTPNYLYLVQDATISASQSLSTERTIFLIDSVLSTDRTNDVMALTATNKGTTAIKVNVSGLYVIDVRVHITLDTAPTSSSYTTWGVYKGTGSNSSLWTLDPTATSTIKVRQNSSGSHEWSGTSFMVLNKNEQIEFRVKTNVGGKLVNSSYINIWMATSAY